MSFLKAIFDTITQKWTAMQRQIKKIGILLRPHTPQATFLQIKKTFESSGIEALLEESSAQMIDYPTAHTLESLAREVDAMCSIGGDGTLLSLIRRLYHHRLPIFGINTGKLGFLTATNPHELSSFASKLSAGDYALQEHMMLESRLHGESYFAINEFLISKDSHAKGIPTIRAAIHKELFNAYRADALIIATPTGSTAYNISAGGSIIYPLCQNILLTPVAAHTLTQRPMVLDSSFTLDFTIDLAGTLTIDGQETISFSPQDTITIKKAENPAILIQKSDRNYFKMLRDKFQWGQE